MAAPWWVGGTTAVQQEDRFTPGGTIEVGDKFKITLTGEDGTTATITATATGTTVASVTADLLIAWNASTSSLKGGITASDQTTYFRLLGTAGVPFYASAATTESDDSPADLQTFVRTATTANKGPNDHNTAANWSGGAVPVAADDVTIDARGGSNSILYGLNQSAVALTSFKHYKGAPAVGTTTYALKIRATTAELGLASNDGSSPSGALCNVDFGTAAAATINVHDSYNTGSAGLQPTIVGGNHASHVLNVYGGIVGLGTLTPGQSCNFPTINVKGGTLTTGTATDWTTVNNSGGAVTLGKGSTSGTLNQYAGTTTVNGATKVGTINYEGGTVNFNARLSGDDIGTLTMNGSGTVDFSGNSDSFTIATLAIKKGGTIRLFKATQPTFTAITNDPTNGTNFNVRVAA